jgi:hypothetical protein
MQLNKISVRMRHKHSRKCLNFNFFHQVLSYKNHAIDEILKDLLASEQMLSISQSLIRIGGSCEEPELQPYTEQSQRSYKDVIFEKYFYINSKSYFQSFKNLIVNKHLSFFYNIFLNPRCLNHSLNQGFRLAKRDDYF